MVCNTFNRHEQHNTTNISVSRQSPGTKSNTNELRSKSMNSEVGPTISNSKVALFIVTIQYTHSQHASTFVHTLPPNQPADNHNNHDNSSNAKECCMTYLYVLKIITCVTCMYNYILIGVLCILLYGAWHTSYSHHKDITHSKECGWIHTCGCIHIYKKDLGWVFSH